MRCPGEAEDAVIGALWEAGTTGIEQLAPGDLRAHFTAAPPAVLARRLGRRGARSVGREEVPARDWVRASRAVQRAVRVGPLLVRPPWSRARARRGETEVVIDPARAFGTGGHESTRLVLGGLARLAPGAGRVLDVGAGSGVLALAALRLGAGRALAVDVDIEAVRAVRANARRNRLAGRVDVVHGGPSAVGGRFPLVVANLTARLLAGLAADLAARVEPGGTLIASGFLARDVAQVRAAFAAHGLAGRSPRHEGEWTSLDLDRPRLFP